MVFHENFAYSDSFDSWNRNIKSVWPIRLNIYTAKQLLCRDFAQTNVKNCKIVLTLLKN